MPLYKNGQGDLPPKFCTHFMGPQEIGASVGVTAKTTRDRKDSAVYSVEKRMR
jgi:hypothetical protein